MVEIEDQGGRKHMLHPDSIASISEAGTSSQWHGIRAYVRMRGGSIIESRSSVDEIRAQLKKLAEPAALPLELLRFAQRYAFLRERPLDAIHSGGVFVGRTPQNVVLNGDDLDEAIDAELGVAP